MGTAWDVVLALGFLVALLLQLSASQGLFPIDQEFSISESFQESPALGQHFMDNQSRPSTHPLLAEHCRLTPDSFTGLEGTPVEGYDLRKVLLLLSPGHRSRHIDFENLTSPDINCDFEEHARLSYHPKVLDFPEVADIYNHMQSGKGGFKIYDSFSKKKVCDDEELSPMGTDQLIILGEYLAEKYVDFKFYEPRRDEFLSASSVQSRASYQTVFAFLHGLLHEKNLVQVKISKSLPNFCSLPNQQCSCPKTEYLEKQIKKGILKGFHIFKDVPNYDPDLNIKLKIPSHADIAPRDIISFLATWICSANLHPCKNGDCLNLSNENLNQIFRSANDHLKFITSSQIFQNHAKLTSFPFIKSAFDWLANNNENKMAVFSSEEDFFIALLSVLGLPTDLVFPQASRLVVEVHESRSHDSDPVLKVYLNGVDVSSILSVSTEVNISKLYLSSVRKHYMEGILSSFKNRNYVDECS